MRTVVSAALAILRGNHVPQCTLVEMQLDSGTLYLATGGISIVHAGRTWLAVGTLGEIDQVRDAAGRGQTLNFTLSGVPSTQIAMALAEPVRNRPVFLYHARLDPDTGAVVDAPLFWSGTLDQMSVRHAANGQVTIGVSAEHAAATLQRRKPLRYTDADQQRLYPGDTCLRFLPSQANHQDVWPAASFWL